MPPPSSRSRQAPAQAANARSLSQRSTTTANANANGPGPDNRQPPSSFSSGSLGGRLIYQQPLEAQEGKQKQFGRNQYYADQSPASSTSSTLPFRQPLPNSNNTAAARGERLASGVSSLSSGSSGSTLPKRKPSLGIFIPTLSNAGAYFLPSFAGSSNANNGGKSPLKRKPVPDSASTQGDGADIKRKSRVSQGSFRRSRISSQNASNNGIFPPRKSSLNSPLPSPAQVRSASISTPGHPNLVGVELVFRDLDQFPHGSTPPAFSPRRINETVESLERLNSSNLNPSTTPNALTNNYNVISTSNPTRRSTVETARNDQHRHEPTSRPYSSQRAYSSSALHQRASRQKLISEFPLPPIHSPSLSQHTHSQPQPSGFEPNMSSQSKTTTGLQPPIQIGVTGEASKSNETITSATEAPKSPGLMASFFGWKGSAPAESPSIQSSPSDSPRPPPQLRHAKTMPANLDIPKANNGAAGLGLGLGTLGTPSTAAPLPSPGLPVPPASSTQVADLEQELQEISKELAGSIRREMELEDELDRVRATCAEQHGGVSERRTSDYFSDSGTTSSRYGGGSDDAATLARIEELERAKRKAELEKAAFKLEMSEKMAEIMKQRRLAEDRVSALEEHVQVQSRTISAATSPAPSPAPMQTRHFGGQLSAAEAMSGGTDQQKRWIRNLEMQLEETRRKVAEERTARANMEELIGGMRYEIGAYREERDRLRDEVVPTLEQRVQDLERAGSISALASPRGKSNSVSFASANGSRARNDSMSQEPRETLVQRVRDLDGQRDALHKALKGLLERHRLVEKNHGRRLRAVQTELSKAMVSQRGAYGIRSRRGSGTLLSNGLLQSNGSLVGAQAGLSFTDGNGLLSPEGKGPQNGASGLGWPGIFTYESRKRVSPEEERVLAQQMQMQLQQQQYHQQQHQQTQQQMLQQASGRDQIRALNIPQAPLGLNISSRIPVPSTSPASGRGPAANGVHIGGGIISPVASAQIARSPASILDPPGKFRKPAAWAV